MDLVREIERDRRRGATALAERALEALARSKEAAPRLLAARPSMPLVGAAVRLAMRLGVPAARRELRASLAAILRQAREVLPPGGRFRVFGASGTVLAAVKAVKGRVVEDGPADVALVGADALLPDGDFVNAKGTEAFVRKARAERCGVFAVASELKRVKTAPPLEKGFERVNGKLVHAILTEKGLRYPPLEARAGVDPTWLDRGALDPEGGRGRCHPHHGSR
jgi:translation initiation factor 2B subunit (eIF-2B alpha/beta/delta family)